MTGEAGPPGQRPGGRIDGRTARAARTRLAVVDALLALNGEGELSPGAARIADRAGVSLRALWTHFKDLETLYAAAGQRLLDRQREAYRPTPVEWPLERRIAEFCHQRAQMLEIIAPAARAASLREPFSAALRRNRAEQYHRAGEELTRLFAPELAAARDRDGLARALTVATTWPAWSTLRDDLGLDVTVATETIILLVSSLLNE